MTTPADALRHFPNASKDTQRLNGIGLGMAAAKKPPMVEYPPRMRQNRGPALNKTEEAFYAQLKARHPQARMIQPHGLTFLLANGCRYTPDFIVDDPTTEPRLLAYEVKGKKFWDDAVVKLKVAAEKFPGVQFWLASKGPMWSGRWQIERVMP